MSARGVADVPRVVARARVPLGQDGVPRRVAGWVPAAQWGVQYSHCNFHSRVVELRGTVLSCGLTGVVPG